MGWARSVVVFAVLALSSGAEASTPCTLSLREEWLKSPSPEGQLFDAHCLPAVSSDGKQVALAVIDGDSARGYGNLRLEIVDLAGKKLEDVVVLTVAEVEKGVEKLSSLKALIEPRLKKANALLASHGFTALESVASSGKEQARALKGADLEASLSGDRLVVKRKGVQVLAKALTPTHARPGPKDLDCSKANPPFVATLWANATVAVVEVAFVGTDMCWEPDAMYFPVPLTK